jgi:DAK2 domain fusion protein YloV
MEAPTSGTIELPVVLRFVEVATDALAEAREEIDALNVYPVPDGDTGTNMYLTVTAAREAITEAVADGADFAQALAAFGRGALLGARGNSGVILSQMLGALGKRLASRGADERNATVVAEAMRAATTASYAAVGTPVEGTMLTVAAAAATAAEEHAQDPSARARDVFTAAAAAAREALARTPEQLQVLADAGVVDAGGRGLSVILDAAEMVLTGRRPAPVEMPVRRTSLPAPIPADDLSEDGPAYEVMYLLEAEDDQVAALRKALAGLGDSLVVVGGDGLWNVHVHVDDVGAAVEAGIEAGRPYRIRVTHFAEQVAEARVRTNERKGRRIVTVAAGPGLAGLFEEAGAVVVHPSERRPSTREVLDAILESGAEEVICLPNDPDSVRVAQIAVQGLAAVAVHDPARTFDQDVLEMTATARHARHGAVTVAARQAITMAGPCEPGDALGVVAGDFAVVGDDLFTVAAEVAERLLAGGGELVTLVAGADDDGLTERLAADIESRHPAVDVMTYDGGQARYPILMAVE